MNDKSNEKPRMKSLRSEDLEFLRSIRGSFGSRRMWAAEYEFTGEDVIERRGGRIKSHIRISDIVEIEVPFASNQMILKADDSKLTVQIPSSLNEVIQEKTAEKMASRSEAERQHFEVTKQKIISQYRRRKLIATAILFALAAFIVWLRQRRILP